jgi:hypothetical protein
MAEIENVILSAQKWKKFGDIYETKIPRLIYNRLKYMSAHRVCDNLQGLGKEDIFQQYM